MAKQERSKAQSLPQEEQSLKATDRVLADKAYADVAALCRKYEIELDYDTAAIVRHICESGAVALNAGKVLNKDWAVSTQLQFWSAQTKPETKQRAFEFLCDMLGHSPQYGSRSTGQLLDITYKSIEGALK